MWTFTFTHHSIRFIVWCVSWCVSCAVCLNSYFWVSWMSIYIYILYIYILFVYCIVCLSCVLFFFPFLSGGCQYIDTFIVYCFVCLHFSVVSCSMYRVSQFSFSFFVSINMCVHFDRLLVRIHWNSSLWGSLFPIFLNIHVFMYVYVYFTCACYWNRHIGTCV